MTDWKTHERVVEAHAVPGEGQSSGRDFYVTYTASVRSHREQYTKDVFQTHCRWGYERLKLRRSIEQVEGDQRQSVDVAEYSKQIPYPSDSTKRDCQHILENSINPAADNMTNRDFWADVIGEDEETVRSLLRSYG